MCRYRGGLALDGGLTDFIPVPPNCPGAVRVACFPSEQLKLFPGIGISPDTFEAWWVPGAWLVDTQRVVCLVGSLVGGVPGAWWMHTVYEAECTRHSGAFK